MPDADAWQRAIWEAFCRCVLWMPAYIGYPSRMRVLGAQSRTGAVAALALLAALAFVVRFGFALETLQYVALTVLLGWASAEDLNSRTIPNPCILAAAGVRAAYFALSAALGGFDAAECALCIASGLGVGAALVVFGLAFERATGREGMGGGDVKLYAVAGLFLGIEGAVFVVLISCVLALAAAALTKPSEGGDAGLARALPFGPAIAVAIVLVALH